MRIFFEFIVVCQKIINLNLNSSEMYKFIFKIQEKAICFFKNGNI